MVAKYLLNVSTPLQESGILTHDVGEIARIGHLSASATAIDNEFERSRSSMSCSFPLESLRGECSQIEVSIVATLATRSKNCASGISISCFVNGTFRAQDT